MNDEERQRLDESAERATADYLRRSSLTYLECCVGLMLTHLGREEVALILERQAAMVRDLG